MTASSRRSFWTSSLVNAARLSLCTAFRSLLTPVSSNLQLCLRRGIAAGQERREDEHDGSLRSVSLLNRRIDDEWHGRFVVERVVRDTERVEHRPHRASDQG